MTKLETSGVDPRTAPPVTGGRGGKPNPQRTGDLRQTNAPARLHGEGLVSRFSPVRGVTPKHVLHAPVWLPVVLNNVTVTDQATQNEYQTLADGMFSQSVYGQGRVAKQLTEIPLDSLTLDWDARWLTVTRQDPKYVRKALKRIHDYGDPVHLLLSWHPHHHRHHDPVWDGHVTFRSLTRELRPGENDTYYLHVDLKQWRDPSTQRRGHQRPHLPTQHRLTAGDTLHSLSKRYYGSYKYADRIRQANGIPAKFGRSTPIVKLPRWHVGSKITIPALRAFDMPRPTDPIKRGKH